MRPRTRLFAAIALILLALVALSFTVPGVAAAIQRWFGYVPGVGLVRQGQIRVLAEPVSLTRDGVTVTVEQVVLESDRITILYQANGIPDSAYVSNFSNDWCTKGMTPTLRFPDWELNEEDMSYMQGGVEMLYQFSATPPAADDAIFVLPCLYNVRAGAVPEDWEIPLHFIPASPEMTALPVIEIPNLTMPAAADSSGISLTIDRAVPMDDRFLIYATLHWEGSEYSSVDFDNPQAEIHLLDANGQEMPYELIDDEYTGLKYDQRRTVFAIKTAPVQSAGPLTIIVDFVKVRPPELPAGVSFPFDPGPDPQPGQTWQLDQDLQIEEYSLRVVSVSAYPGGYSFEMESDSGILGADLADLVHPIGAGGGGGEGGRFGSSFTYVDGLPAGPVTVTIMSIDVRLDGPWQATWNPPAIVGEDTPGP